MKKELYDKIVEIVTEVMGLNIEDFDKDKPINTISEWDSFNNLMLVSKFEEVFKIEFSVEEVEEVKTIQNLLDLMEKKTN